MITSSQDSFSTAASKRFRQHLPRHYVPAPMVKTFSCFGTIDALNMSLVQGLPTTLYPRHSFLQMKPWIFFYIEHSQKNERRSALSANYAGYAAQQKLAAI